MLKTKQTNLKVAKWLLLIIGLLTILVLLVNSLNNFYNNNILYFQTPVLIKTQKLLVIKKRKTTMVNPQGKIVKLVEAETPTYNIDLLIGEYADKFATAKKSSSYLRYQLHCLANKESGHYSSTRCGDLQRACGPFQFWEDTYLSFRKIMMENGLVKTIGSRWDLKDATETTAWALVNGHDTDWGPIGRGDCL